MIVLQETHSTLNCEKIWQSEWGGKIIFSHGESNARGVCILIVKNLSHKIINVETDTNGRLICIEINVDNVLYNLNAIYAPNTDNPNFFQELRQKMSNKCEKRILAGDLNLTFDVQLERLNTFANNSKSREVLTNLMEEFLIEDVWRIRNPDTRHYSWIKKSNPNSPVRASRLDYILTSQGLKIDNITYCPAPNTDHRAAFISVKTSDKERGAGYWKLNVSHLNNKEFLAKMNADLETVIHKQYKDPLERWELIKKQIVKTSQQFSRNHSATKKLIISNLMEKVDELDSQLPLPPQMQLLLENTRIDLENLTTEEIHSTIFRSKAKWYSEGEQNTRYFYSLEKARYNAKICETIINEITGKEIESESEIMNAQYNFYKELYTSDTNIDFKLDNKYGIYVPSELVSQQNMPFDNKEIATAALQLKNNKTPGPDGIPIDFYKVFWKIIQPPLVEMIHYAYENKRMHESALEGILNLIPKSNKDSRYLKNLRPITLLNSDYKIIEKCISNKLKSALKIIINKDQTGFMRERRISSNIRKLFDLMSYCEKNQIPAQILSCDFAKCFDRVEKCCIIESLNFFGIAPYIVEWVNLLYTDFYICIQNNGKFTDKIPIERSIHQGGACSAELFLISAEILAILLRSNEKIKGIPVKEILNLLNQFADDLDVTSEHNQENMNNIIYTFDHFKNISGFQLSYDKTSIYRIGSIRSTDAKLYTQHEINWTNEPINVLGITVSHDLDQCLENNYAPVLTKMNAILNSWGNRDLSLIGKVNVVNTLVASLFVYKMTVLLNIPDKLIKNIYNQITKFLWNGKKSKIALKTLQREKKRGGLGLVDLKKREIALKSTWIQIIENDPKLKNLAFEAIGCNLNEDIWKCNMSRKDILENFSNTVPKFWLDVLVAWSYTNFKNIDETQASEQTIWLNSHIRIDKKMFFLAQSI